jgi:hypothetical protein
MTMEEWEATYKPIYNHIDSNASFQDETGNGIMFETYGDEVEFVKQQDPNKIWLYGQGDEGMYIWSGWGVVNRIGYFITEVPFPEDTDIQITVEDWTEEVCEDCAEFIEEDEEHICEEQ